MRIGLFGGSFNPVHVGHIALAQQLRTLAKLDEVWLMVSPQNPLKQSAQLLDDQLRYEMTRKAVEQEPGLVACDYELHLPKPSYTWHTLEHLSKDYPQHSFVLLIGGDNWLLFHQWYHADDILRNFPIVVYPRRGSEIDNSLLPANVSVVETALLDISSTEVRERVKQGRAISGMVPSCIEQMVTSYYLSDTPDI
jgi:nicotinate-nucleotide adenylyltransferase